MLELSPKYRHYDAATAPQGILRHVLPGMGTPGLPGYPKMIWAHRYLVYNFFRRELLGRFHGSMLGVFWVLVQPMFMFAVYYAVFGILIGNYRQGSAPDPNFAFYLFSGMITFQALSEATSSACSSVVGNSNLVKKVAFPSEVLPVDTVMVSQVTFLVAFGVALLAWVICSWIGFDLPIFQPSWLLLALPLVVVVQGLTALGIGLFLANLYVFARDVRHLWGIITTAWMFATPIFWLPSMLESKFGGLAWWMFNLNPAYSLVMCNRQLLGAQDASLPGGQEIQFGDFWTHLGVASMWAALFMVVGYGCFMSRKHRYADLV